MDRDRVKLKRCPVCVAASERSQLDVVSTATTLLGAREYYDESGRWHYHDLNVTHLDYRCSAGHRWTEHHRASCWCGWQSLAATPSSA